MYDRKDEQNLDRAAACARTAAYLLERLEELTLRLDTLSLDLAVTRAAGKEGGRFKAIQDELGCILVECAETASRASAQAGPVKAEKPEAGPLTETSLVGARPGDD